MSDPILLDQLATEVWNLYISNTEEAEKNIDAFLKKRFSQLPNEEKLRILEKLCIEFEGVSERSAEKFELDDDLVSQISVLLLGKEVLSSGISSERLAQRLADALNTIFDGLNNLISLINRTLYGSQDNDKTIRQMIGSQLEGVATANSLETHLGQISKAFLTVQRSFKETAHNEVAKILNEIDPEQIAKESGRVFKIGLFRKAEWYERYRIKYGRIKRWFDSDRFMEDFLREFEKKCQEIAKK